MAIVNIGSINWDHRFHVRALPTPGATIAATSVSRSLGGKGLNHSVAILRAGGIVRHHGRVGARDGDILDAIAGLDLACDDILPDDEAESGSAFITIDAAGENQIVISAGANTTLTKAQVSAAIDTMAPGDWLLLQNETNNIDFAARLAQERGHRVALVAAPFDPALVATLLPHVDLLAVNETEYAQLCRTLGGEDSLGQRPSLFVSLGGKGAFYRNAGRTDRAKAHAVTVKDTTGAGDTAFGAFLARLDRGDSAGEALRFAMAAGALQVTRAGSATVIPTEAEVRAFLAAEKLPPPADDQG